MCGWKGGAVQIRDRRRSLSSTIRIIPHRHPPAPHAKRTRAGSAQSQSYLAATIKLTEKATNFMSVLMKGLPRNLRSESTHHLFLLYALIWADTKHCEFNTDQCPRGMLIGWSSQSAKCQNSALVAQKAQMTLHRSSPQKNGQRAWLALGVWAVGPATTSHFGLNHHNNLKMCHASELRPKTSEMFEWETHKLDRWRMIN